VTNISIPPRVPKSPLQSFWFWVGLGFGVKSLQTEREREKPSCLSSKHHFILSSNSILCSVPTTRCFFVFVFVFRCRESQNSLSLTVSHSFRYPTLSRSILRISLSYFYAFRGSVILFPCLSLWFTFKFALFSVPLFPSVFFPLDSTLKKASKRKLLIWIFSGFCLCVH
jgi:hypothetical protein